MSAASTVAVNLLWCVPGEVGGSEEYLARQLVGLREHDHGLDIVVYAPAGYAAAHPEIATTFALVEAPVDGRSRSRRVLAEHTWLASRTRRADLVHHGGGTVPALGGRPVVLTVHDLQYRTYPHYFSRLKREYLARRVPQAIARSRVVAVPSEFVRGTVIEAFDVDPSDVIVVRHGLETDLEAHATPEVLLRHRYALGETTRLLVYPAVTHPHKRHDFLLDLMARRWTDDDLRLVLLGGRGLADDEVERRLRTPELRGRVIRPGRVPAADRDGLILAATAVVFPSEYEGFGAPVLEAMALGTPVIASDRAAVPEVLGGAGVSLPLDADAWAGALHEVERSRAQLSAAGLRRAAAFTVRDSAADLLRAYRRGLR